MSEPVPLPMFERAADRPVAFRYTNHRGETAERHVMPYGIKFGAMTPYYPQAEWLLDAFDIDKRAARTFALSRITGWRLLAEDELPRRGG